jgi:hypothetical protein
LFWWCRSWLYGALAGKPQDRDEDKEKSKKSKKQQKEVNLEAAMFLTEASVVKLLQNIGFSAKLDLLREDL